MTKAEAYEILSKRIDNLCIPDVIGSSTEEMIASVGTMIAILSDINSTAEVLKELVRDG